MIRRIVRPGLEARENKKLFVQRRPIPLRNTLRVTAIDRLFGEKK